MKLCSNFSKSSYALKQASRNQCFSEKSLSFRGYANANSSDATVVCSRRKSEGSQITKPEFYISILRNSDISREIRNGSFPKRFMLKGRSGIAKNAFSSMVDLRCNSEGTQFIKADFYVSVLRKTAVSKCLQTGKMVHCWILRDGYDSDLFVSNNLVHMYSKCGMIYDALQMFDIMSLRDVVSWNTLISGFVGFGFFRDGFRFFLEMKRVGVFPSQSSFVTLLVASAGLASFEICRQVHAESLKSGFSSDLCVGNALLTAYIKCGDFVDMRKMLNQMPNLDEISFEIMISGYLQCGSFDDAFELFNFSRFVGIDFSIFPLSGLISSCASPEFFNRGIQIHGLIIKAGQDLDTSIVNSLITMYVRSDFLEDAQFLFERSRNRDIVTWNSMIGGYALNGHGEFAMGLVGKFLSLGMKMNNSTFASFLSASSTITVLGNAKQVHVLILKLKEAFDQKVDNTILTMYCRCNIVNHARTVFETMKERDVVSFNLLIGLFRDICDYEEAIRVFFRSQSEGLKVDQNIYSSVISCCTKLFSLYIGQQIHTCIVKSGFEKVFPLENSLLGMYAQCGRFDDMKKFFEKIENPDIVSWNLMISGYTHYGFKGKSIRIWREMQEVGINFNEFSYSSILDACNCFEDLVWIEQIQAQIVKSGLVFDTILMNSLITSYANCGMMEKASLVFEEVHFPDCVSWNAMVSGYAQNGFAEKSLRLYVLMNHIFLKPNHMTFVSITRSCSILVEPKLGAQFHAQIIRSGLESDVSVSNSLITMYAKCGSINDAFKIFQNTIYKDLITWNSMIYSCAHHGYGREALEILERMKLSGIKPSAVTFVGVLSACSHAGLVSEGWNQFKSMDSDYGITPNEDHFACMVDILCRANQLREAKKLIESMPFNPCSLIWRTLLSACRLNEDVELGEIAAERIMQLEPKDSSPYVLLSHIYDLAEKREDKVEMRKMMKERGIKKETGCSWIWS